MKKTLSWSLSLITALVLFARSSEHACAFLALILVVFLTLSPGLLGLVLWKRRQVSNSLWCFGFSLFTILFYLFIYILVDVVPERIFQLLTPNEIVSAGTLLLIMLGFVALVKMNLYSDLKQTLLVIRKPLIFYLAVVALCHFHVTRKTTPISNYDYSHVSKAKTMLSIRTHDSYFQYINGIAISNHEPFSKHYGKRKLIYDFVDREMLAGVIYSVFNRIMGGMGSRWWNSFLVYQDLAIALGAFIVFPCFWLATRWFPTLNPTLLMSFVCIAPFVMINIFYAWFKMPAAALYLSGLIFLLNSSSRVKTWITTGFLWGAAASMHASAALGYPVTLVWLFFLRRKELGLRRFLPRAFALCVFFYAGYCPWSIVKKVYYYEKNTLILQAFTHGYNERGQKSLAEIYINFLKITPLEEQWTQRAKQVQRFFKAEEFKNLLNLAQEGKIHEFVWYHNYLEVDYFIFAFLPQFLFLILLTAGYFYFRIGIKTHPNIFAPSLQLNSEPIGFSLFTLANVFFLLVASYTKHDPDCLFTQPLGLILIISIMFTGTFLTWNAIVRKFYVVFMTLMAIKLIWGQILIDGSVPLENTGLY